jgi:hypothetical protein
VSHAYLLARLPPLYPDTTQRPCSVDEFLSLVLDPAARRWCADLLAWLALANAEAQGLGLPLPYPDAPVAEPTGTSGSPAWRAYYRRLLSIDAPPLLRVWAAEDAAAVAQRARLGGTDAGLELAPVRAELHPLLASADTAPLDAAAAVDRQYLDYVFRRLEQHVAAAAPDAEVRVFAYAIRLLLLTRIGTPLEYHDAA